MARTYKADGLRVSYLIRGLLIMILLVLLYKEYIDGIIFGFGIFISIIIGGILGKKVTLHKRKMAKERKLNKNNLYSKNTIEASTDYSTDEELILADVHTLTGYQFERLMELYYVSQGYKVNRVGGSGDHEVDLILIDKKGFKIAVQCKRWKKNVGNDIILRLKAGKQIHNCYDAWVVTTSYFTKAAMEAANKLNIKMINGLILDRDLNKWRKQRAKDKIPL